jgi:hypothetical protein
MFFGRGKGTGLAGDPVALAEAMRENAGWNYFLKRRPQRPVSAPVGQPPQELIPLLEPTTEQIEANVQR